MLNKLVARPVLPAILLVASALTGCSASSSGQAEPDASRTVAGADLPADDPRSPVTEEPVLDSPLQAYRLTATELATVYFARDLLVQSCMGRFGFDYTPARSFADSLHAALTQERWDISRVYGISNRAWAEKYGYGLPPAAETTPTASAPDESEAFEFVLRGQRPEGIGTPPAPFSGPEASSPGEIDGQAIPAGGCAGEARVELGASDSDVSDYGFAHDLWVDGDSKVKASAAYRQAISDWTACMADQGYRVTDPLDDEGDIKALLSREDEGTEYVAPTEREIALAVADVDCKDEVDLISRIRSIENKVASRAIEENQIALEADRNRLDAQVRRATRIVEQHGA